MSKQRYVIGDCLDIMKLMDSNSVDLVITSPPYGNARKSLYDSIHPDNYIQWFKPIAKEIYRLLKPTGSFILNIGDNTIDGETHLYTYEIPIVLKREIGFKFIDPLIWCKSNTPPGKFKNRFKSSWEFCYHFSKTLNITFNPYEVSSSMKKSSIERACRYNSLNINKSQTGSGFTNTNKTIYNNIKNGNIKNALPSNVLYFSSETLNKQHPAVFPIKLPTFFIKAFSNKNDIILDPFCGSGTTLEACRLLDRNGIGIEKNKLYEKIIIDRAMINIVNLTEL
jgi:DNA modification methylase